MSRPNMCIGVENNCIKHGKISCEEKSAVDFESPKDVGDCNDKDM